MRHSLIAFCLAFAACGNNNGLPVSCDTGGNCPPGQHCFNSLCYVDGTIDLAGLFGDGGADFATAPVCLSTMEGKDVARSYTLPQSKADFALDLNGDGKLDNQWGNIIGALAAQNLDPQGGVDQALAAGQLVLLFDQTGATLTDDGCTRVTFSNGVNHAGSPPLFDGSDVFTVDTSQAPGTFTGSAAGGAFNSPAPATATAATETEIMLPLPILFGAQTTPSHLYGAHLQFTRVGDNLMKGQINGAMKESDVQNNMIPAIAVLLTQRVQANPNTPTSMQLLNIFDTGGKPLPGDGCNTTCKNHAPGAADFNQCAIAGDGIISTCEVATNSIIKNVLAPDVQMFAADGVTYMPSAANTAKDSLSVGVAFTAVRASF
jgi:hypothetical protein